MILVDPRNGSKRDPVTQKFEPIEGVLPLLLKRNVEAEEFDLQFGDFSFEGFGANGVCMIGIERKRITDLITSIRQGRLAAQLIGMHQMYQYRVLLIEGICRPNPNDGILEMMYREGWKAPNMGSRVPLYSEMSRALTTFQLQYPSLVVIRSANIWETAWHVVDTYHYFNSKRWEDHHAHEALPTDGHVEVFKASLLRRVANELSKIGWEKSKTITQYFGSVVELANASLRDWENIPGIGKILAQKIFDELRGNSNGK